MLAGAGFHLVLQNGTTDIAGDVQSGSGTTKITVVFEEGAAGNLTSANVARGYDVVGTVSDDTDDATVVDGTDGNSTPNADEAVGNVNPLQAADAGNSGNSDTPDLVSATFDDTTKGSGGAADVVLYKFDEAVTVPLDARLFKVYSATTGDETRGNNGTATRSTADNTVVRVEFPNDTLLDATGASVYANAVQENQPVGGRNNLPDEVGVANSNTVPGSSSTTERTAGPDLTGVAVNPVKDVFGTITGYTATYTFDEALVGADVNSETAFHLVAGDGTRLTSSACKIDQVPTSATDPTPKNSNTATCTAYGTATPNQVNQAVLGTVEYNAVDDGTNGNPEGAEVVTGATAGSPQA